MVTMYSIIIPIYNVAPYLRECLDSVLAQTVNDPASPSYAVASWEAICVDDGSTDASGAILDEYAAKDGRFRVFHQHNKGVSAARNAALELACGKWIWFVDGDDVITPDALERMSVVLGSDSYDAVFTTRPHTFKANESPLATSRGSGNLRIAIDANSIGKDLLFGADVLMGFPVIRFLRRTIFGDVRFPEGVPMMEDTLSLVDVLSKTARWARVDLQIYSYRKYLSSSHIVTDERACGLIDVFVRLYNDAQYKLGCSEEEAFRFCRQSIDALCLFVMSVILSGRCEERVRVARKYLSLEKLMHRRFLSCFMQWRCIVLDRYERPFAFGLIRAVEYLYCGTMNKLSAFRR